MNRIKCDNYIYGRNFKLEACSYSSDFVEIQRWENFFILKTGLKICIVLQYLTKRGKNDPYIRAWGLYILIEPKMSDLSDFGHSGLVWFESENFTETDP